MTDTRIMSLVWLDQDRIWIDKDGVRHRLDTMDPDHRANLIPFLRGNVRTLYSIDRGFPVALRDDIDPIEAEEWLAATPLMRKLVELEQGRPIDDRRATNERNRRHERETGYQKVRLG